MREQTVTFWVYKTVMAALAGLVTFFLVATYNRLTSIESELLQVRLDLARMKIPTGDEIRELCRIEIMKAERARQ